MDINLGHHVRKQMHLKGMKQADLAKSLGLHTRSIPQFIRRKHYNTKMLIRLCNVLEHDFLKYLYADDESSETLLKIKKLQDENKQLREEVDFLKKVITKMK